MAPLTFPAPTTLTSPATSSSLSPRASRAVAVRSRVPSAARATTRTPTLTPTPTLLAAVAATVTTTTQPPALESTAPSSAWLLLVVSLLFCKRTARSRCCPLAAWDGDKRRVWGFPGLGGALPLPPLPQTVHSHHAMVPFFLSLGAKNSYALLCYSPFPTESQHVFVETL